MVLPEQSTDCNNNVVLECENLKKTFASPSGTVDVLNGVNLTVKTGEIVIIHGKSGAGKSTLLQILAGLDRPNAGTVAFCGINLESMSNCELSRMRQKNIGIIFQHSNLLPRWTAIENVEAAIYHKRLARKTRRELAMGLLCNLGLGDRWRHMPSELSAGEQQRVAIARALINEPKIILADEPTGDVDPQTAAKIANLLAQCVRMKETSLLLVTHGAFPCAVADRRFILANGVLDELYKNH